MEIVLVLKPCTHGLDLRGSYESPQRVEVLPRPGLHHGTLFQKQRTAVNGVGYFFFYLFSWCYELHTWCLSIESTISNSTKSLLVIKLFKFKSVEVGYQNDYTPNTHGSNVVSFEGAQGRERS